MFGWRPIEVLWEKYFSSLVQTIFWFLARVRTSTVQYFLSTSHFHKWLSKNFLWVNKVKFMDRHFVLFYSFQLLHLHDVVDSMFWGIFFFKSLHLRTSVCNGHFNFSTLVVKYIFCVSNEILDMSLKNYSSAYVQPC